MRPLRRLGLAFWGASACARIPAGPSPSLEGDLEPPGRAAGYESKFSLRAGGELVSPRSSCGLAGTLGGPELHAACGSVFFFFFFLLTRGFKKALRRSFKLPHLLPVKLRDHCARIPARPGARELGSSCSFQRVGAFQTHSSPPSPVVWKADPASSCGRLLGRV